MRSLLVKTAWVMSAVVGALLLFVLGILIFANTNPGRGAVAALAGPLLGGHVSIQGLSGRFPDAPTAEHMEIRDARGVWLKLDRVSARWSPLQLLRNRISAHSVTAASATLLRMPVPEDSKGSTPPIDIKRLGIGRLVIGPAVVSRTMTISIYGAIYYTSSSEFSGVAHVRRLDAPGEYQIRGRLQNSDLSGTADIQEPAGGFVAGILGLPELGPLAVQAHASGRQSANRVQVTLTAGALHAGAQGKIDLLRRAAEIEFEAGSPGMNLRSDLSWQSLALKGTVRGAFAAPDVSAHVVVLGFRADGGSVRSVSGEVEGRHGDLYATGRVEALRVPGSHPDLFAAAPMTFEAHARLDASPRTVDVTLRHPLLALGGHLVTEDAASQGVFTVRLPLIGGVAAEAGIDAQGRADLHAIITVREPLSSVAVNGTVRLDGGSSALVRLLGRDSRFAALISAKSGDLAIDRATLDSTGASASAAGKWQDGNWDVSWKAALKDLSRLAATLTGRVALQGRVSGRNGLLAVIADGNAAVATRGFASGPVHIALRTQGLPQKPSGTIDVAGKLDGAPLAFGAALSRAAKGAWQVVLNRGDWRSVHMHGTLTASAALSPLSGKFEVHAGRLADVQPLLGQPIGGKLDGTADFVSSGGRARAHVLAVAQTLTYGDARVGSFKVAGDIAEPLTSPEAKLTYAATNFSDDQVSGNFSGTVNGPQSALAVTLASDLRAVNGQTAQIAGAATANIPRRQLTLRRYDVHAAGQTVHLLAPARFDLVNGIAVDLLRVAAARSEVDIAGRIMPRLEATVHLRNATGDLLRPFYPEVATEGSLSGAAKLTGTLAAPQGTVTLDGKGLQVGFNGSAAAPPADLTATAILHGTAASVHAILRSGTRIQLTVTGDAPLKSTGDFNLHATGTGNLAVLDTILNAEGRSLHGMLAVDAQLTGTLAQPRVAGNAHLSDGEFQDFVRGIHISGISTSLYARGDRVDINNFSARAGDGTITGGGSIDLTAPGEPLSLSFVAKNAKPISNSVLNAALDANLKLTGKLAQQDTLSGTVNVRRAEIDIPDSLPSSVAVLTLRGKGGPPPPPPIAMALDLSLRSDGQLFVRGHGVEAEMSGKLHIGGTTIAPDVTGGFDLKRGNLSLAGQTLDFTSGRVSFDGSSLRQRIDPALDLVAQTTAAGTSATLTVSGHASSPKITLTSAPPLPQDEVLSRLLFGQNTTQLSPWQIAQLGQALASLGGMGGLGDPLSRVRKSLGLDRLAVTTAGASGTQTAVEAGRYVAHNIYVGAKQGVSGAGGTQAIVQIDLTKHLKLQTQISSNNAPTPVSPGTTPVDTGSNLGLSYQFEY
jgi:translocation and assembly module TamB